MEDVKKNCPYSHSVLKCDLCNVLATSQEGYLSHLNGRKHKDTVTAEGKAPIATQFACKNCAKYCAHQAALKYHYSSREHSKMQRAIQFENAKVLAQSDKEGPKKQFSQAFDRSFLNGHRFDVQFKYNRIPWRRMQFAVEQVNDITGWDQMYRSSLASQKAQEKAKFFESLQACPPTAWNPFNKLIAQNPEQCRAVSTIVTGSHRPFPFLLFGRPFSHFSIS